MKSGDRRALSRLLTLVEERSDQSFHLLTEIWSLTRPCFSVGITGPAGSGKSTLIDQLIGWYRKQNKKVAVVAIDPSSPFTGGAVLGDRIRMQRHSGDPGVFIRSVGSRGKSGGVSFSTRAVMRLFTAFGADVILVETVGAGQSEVDVVDLVDATVVVLTPESGDSVQALKAGLLEIADIFVVNKKDRQDAERMASELSAHVSSDPKPKAWVTPVLLTEGRSGEGVNELGEALAQFEAHLAAHPVGEEEATKKRLREVREIVKARFSFQVLDHLKENSDLLSELKSESSPNLYAVAENFLAKLGLFTAEKRPKAKSGK